MPMLRVGTMLAAATLAGLAQAWSQTSTGATPAAEAGATPADPGIEVSLGRDEVKRQVADALGVEGVDVPLSVRLDLDVAKRVCAETVFDSALDSNRSCTATQYAPELAEAARAALQVETAPPTTQ